MSVHVQPNHFIVQQKLQGLSNLVNKLYFNRTLKNEKKREEWERANHTNNICHLLIANHVPGTVIDS